MDQSIIRTGTDRRSRAETPLVPSGAADASLVESFDDDGSEVVQIASRSHEMGGRAKERTTSVITQAEDIDDHRRHVLLVCLSSPTKGTAPGAPAEAGHFRRR